MSLRLLAFTQNAWEDYLFWKSTDEKTSRRVDELIKNTMRTPFEGLGKPEPLRGELSGKWSRRINSRDRMVYAVEEETLYLVALRKHYG
ncbi:MAG: Txe/YoeB family addiction module toxin [Candidatus Spyradenecus sp.]